MSILAYSIGYYRQNATLCLSKGSGLICILGAKLRKAFHCGLQTWHNSMNRHFLFSARAICFAVHLLAIWKGIIANRWLFGCLFAYFKWYRSALWANYWHGIASVSSRLLLHWQFWKFKVLSQHWSLHYMSLKCCQCCNWNCVRILLRVVHCSLGYD